MEWAALGLVEVLSPSPTMEWAAPIVFLRLRLHLQLLPTTTTPPLLRLLPRLARRQIAVLQSLLPSYHPLIASNYAIFSICASETARFFFVPKFRLRRVLRTSYAQPKERIPTWAKEIPIHGRGNVPVDRNPTPKPHKTPKIKPSAKTARCRNQIFTLLGVYPLNFP